MKISLGRRDQASPKVARRAPPVEDAPRVRRQRIPDPDGPRLVIGVMTGTSLDGLDACLLRIEGKGLALKATLLDQVIAPLGAIGDELRRLADQQLMTAREIATLARDFSLLHATALQPLVDEHEVDLIAVHGQTVFHAPPVSWQLFNPALLAHAVGVPVVCDLRAADLAAGGQGAPITPLADHLLFRQVDEARTVVNLGGFCNLTILPSGLTLDGIAGRDVCACNQLLDAAARLCLGRPYDDDGETAMAGEVLDLLFTSLTTLLDKQQRAGRSLGTGDELAGWLAKLGDRRPPPPDLLRTVVAAVAHTICRQLGDTRRVILAGGGCRNQALMLELKHRAGRPVTTTAKYGIPIDLREAAAMALLGTLCQDRIPITLPNVTRVTTAPVAGVWAYP